MKKLQGRLYEEGEAPEKLDQDTIQETDKKLSPDEVEQALKNLRPRLRTYLPVVAYPDPKTPDDLGGYAYFCPMCDEEKNYPEESGLYLRDGYRWECTKCGRSGHIEDLYACLNGLDVEKDIDEIILGLRECVKTLNISLEDLDRDLNFIDYQTFFHGLGYDDDDTIYLRTFNDQDKDEYGHNKQIELWNFDQIIPDLERENQNNRGVFFVVNGGGQKTEYVKTVRAVFADFDDYPFDEQVNRLNKFPLAPSIVIRTKRSLHPYWILKGDRDKKKWREIQARVIQYFGSDPKIKDLPRVMRLYRFEHRKEDPVMVRLIKFDPDLQYELNEFHELLPPLEGKTVTPSKTGTRVDVSVSVSSSNDLQKRDEIINWVEDWMNRFNVEELSREITEDGQIKIFVMCPWREDHTDEVQKPKDSFIWIHPDEKGVWKIYYYCSHAHCTDRKWIDFRMYHEPDYTPPEKTSDEIQDDQDEGASGENDSKNNRKPSSEILLYPLSDFKEKEAEFLIPNRIPKGQITILGGEGGSGKTYVWIDTVSAITSGKKCLLSDDVPFPINDERRKVIIFNAEDDIERVLKARLRSSGADESNILSLSLSDKSFSEIKFDNSKLEGIIQRYKPILIVFDPLQAFIPPSVNMGARNAMRACLNPLIGLGEKYDVSFLIVMHTNKQTGAWGRKRLADSSDMWDIARSVLMVGKTLDGLRYVSHEKNNYGQQASTILFSIENDQVVYKGISHKKDQDFVSEYYQEVRSAPAREGAENMILSYLMDHENEKVEIGKMDQDLIESGITKGTLRRAKDKLKEEGKIRFSPVGGGNTRKWYVSIIQNKMSK